MTKRKTLPEKLELIERVADDKIRELALRYRRTVLIPFCKENRYTLSVDMVYRKTWTFVTEDYQQVNRVFIPIDICITLNRLVCNTPFVAYIPSIATDELE